MKPLCIDLFCGLGGWTEGFLAEGWDVVGFDIEQHIYDEHRYPAQLVIQDVLTIHGKQFRNARMIVASPPCQEFSYMAMPWTRAKEKARKLREGPPEDRARLTALFDACFRIQCEASENVGRYIPLVVENVKGAQPWVGRANWHYGSYYLWGDVPALMPTTRPHAKVPGMGAGWRPPGHPDHQSGLDFNTRAERQTKNDGGSWFNVAHNTESGKNRNPVHDGQKTAGHANKRDGHSHTRHLTHQRESDAVKQGGSWFHDSSPGTLRSHGSKSSARKAASARIAKIPFPLAQHIAHVYYPQKERVA